jgi:hypothetical protein
MKVIRVSAIWCMSCLVMRNRWNKFFSSHPEIEIIDYDFDEDQEEIKDYNVGNVLPVMIILENDQEVERVTGEKSLKQLEKIFSKFI